MTKLFFYLIIRPLSYLPLSVLYVLSDFLYLLIWKVFGYRKKVVWGNLRNSFPEKSDEELGGIARKFYAHICDLLVESIRMYQMPKAEGLRRFHYIGREVSDPYFDQGKSVIAMTAHYNSWELAGLAVQPQTKHQFVAIYAPLRNAFINKKIYSSRSRFGTELVPRRETASMFEAYHGKKLTGTVFVSDQSPTSAKCPYWTNFLNQDTGFSYGAARYAVKYNYPIFFAYITKPKRGHYELYMELMDEQPANTTPEALLEEYARRLEKLIQAEPQYWLWSHKRWKKSKADYPAIPKPNEDTEAK